MSPDPSSESALEDPDEDPDDEGGAAKLGDIMLAAVCISPPPSKLLMGPPVALEAPEPVEPELEA